jgi:WD40 repeat protein
LDAAVVLTLPNVLDVVRRLFNRINSVAIDRAGLLCVTASDDRSVRVWSIERGKCEAVLSGHGKSSEHPRTPCHVTLVSFSFRHV